MSRCDRFVLLDNVPFSKNSYQNRSRIKTQQGAMWLTVPILQSGQFGQPTNLVQIDKRSKWAVKHWRTIRQNYCRAPFFDFLAACFESVYQVEWDFMADLNVELIKRVAMAVNITTPVVRATSLGVNGIRSHLLCSLTESVGGTEYLSGPSGRDYLDTGIFSERRIKLSYHEFTEPAHKQLFGEFVFGLSVIDLLANCGPESRHLLVA